MSETCLTETAVCLADESQSLEQIAPRLGLTDREVRRYRRFFGMNNVRCSPGRDVAGLLVGAARGLATLPGNEESVRFIIHARTLEAAGPYSANPLHQVADELNLRHATAFVASQHACASGLLAMDIAGRLLTAQGDRGARALILMGEKSYPHVTDYVHSPMVMGEASVACLVGLGGERNRLLSYATRVRGEFCQIPGPGDAWGAGFDNVYPGTLAEVIHAAIDQAGLTPEDIRLFFPHNVSKISWIRVCQTAGLSFKRVWLATLPNTGHCFCADPVLNLADAVAARALQPGDHCLLVSVGVGATFSAMVVRH